jgi:hypothetical protein
MQDLYFFFISELVGCLKNSRKAGAVGGINFKIHQLQPSLLQPQAKCFQVLIEVKISNLNATNQ